MSRGLVEDLFLSHPDKIALAGWQPQEEGKSIVGLVLSPLWDLLARSFPVSVAPNVLSLAAVIAAAQAW